MVQHECNEQLANFGCFRVLVLGTNGAGKSTLVGAVWAEEGYILSPVSGDDGYRHAATPRDVQLVYCTACPGATIVVDDAEMLSSRQGSEWKDMIVAHRHDEKNLVFVARSLNTLPPIVLSTATIMVVFTVPGLHDLAALKGQFGIDGVSALPPYTARVYATTPGGTEHA